MILFPLSSNFRDLYYTSCYLTSKTSTLLLKTLFDQINDLEPMILFLFPLWLKRSNVGWKLSDSDPFKAILPLSIINSINSVHSIYPASIYRHTVCPRSSDPFYAVTYYIKLVITSWTHSTFFKAVR